MEFFVSTPERSIGLCLNELDRCDAVILLSGSQAGSLVPSGAGVTYTEAEIERATIARDDAAAERMKKIPAFVRGMVVGAVEESCRKNGLDRVTVEELERIRARMPTPKLFG